MFMTLLPGEGVHHVIPQKISGTQDVTVSLRIGRPRENCTIALMQGETVLAVKKMKKPLPAEMIQIMLPKAKIQNEQEIKVRVIC